MCCSARQRHRCRQAYRMWRRGPRLAAPEWCIRCSSALRCCVSYSKVALCKAMLPSAADHHCGVGRAQADSHENINTVIRESPLTAHADKIQERVRGETMTITGNIVEVHQIAGHA